MAEDKRVCTAGMAEISGVITAAVESGANVKLTVTGNSMYPLFRSGIDSVVLAKTPLQKYSILLYKRENGSFILHRVVKTKGDLLYMAGDFETEIEFPVHSSQVVAGVKAFYRSGRYFDCSNPFYRFYSVVWVFLLPYRRFGIVLVRKLGPLKRFLRRGNGEK